MNTLAPSFQVGSFLFLQVTMTSITSQTNLRFAKIGPRTAELAALERLEKYTKTFNGRNVVNIECLAFLGENSWSCKDKMQLCHVDFWFLVSDQQS